MNKKIIALAFVIIGFFFNSSSQLGKLKGFIGKKDTTKIQEPKEDTPKKEGGGFGAGLINKALSKVSKAAFAVGAGATGLITSTDDLTTVAFAPGLMQNLHPREVQEIGQDFFNGWEPGGTGIIIMFASKEGIKITKINGEVKIDGVKANTTPLGIYSSFAKGNQPKKVEIITKSGQNSSFTIHPPTQKVKLLSINGQTKNAVLDMNKDVVLEFAEMPEDTKTPIMVQLTGNTIGIKTLYTVGWFAPKTKIVIPPAMFRNMYGAESNIGFEGCYLQVSRSKSEKASQVSGIIAEIEYGTMINDGMFVNVPNKPNFNKGIEAKGKEGEVNYVVNKKIAASSVNFGSMKNLGVLAFAAKGSTSYYDSKTKYVIGGGYETTSKMATFPQFSNEVWDNILAKLYLQITDILAKEFNVNVVDVEKITNLAIYKTARSYDTPETNTKSEFFVNYKNTKSLNGLRPFAEMGSSLEHKVMEEANVNSLLKLTLNLKMSFEGSVASMTPSLDFEILGPVVGSMYPTNYLSGSVTGEGYPIKNKAKIDANTLENNVLGLNSLTASFKKAMKDIKAKEKANGDYDIEWAAINQ